MSKVTHPKCGKTFPGGSSAGHCSACCETFIGLAAFEAHRRGEHGVDRRCEITNKHWTDNRGYWHVGAKLTEEQKAKMWPKDEEEPVSAWDLLGSAPDFTDGKSVDEYMDEQRDRNPE